jgi:hypothetical protein
MTDARSSYEDLWELLGEVPAEQILKKIDREWPSHQLEILTALKRIVPMFAPEVAWRAAGAREVIRGLEQRLT